MGFIKISTLRDQVAKQDAYITAYNEKVASSNIPRMTTVADAGDDILGSIKSAIPKDVKDGLGDVKDTVINATARLGNWVHNNPKTTLGSLAAMLAARKIFSK